MSSEFLVLTTSRFDREFKKLIRQHPDQEFLEALLRLLDWTPTTAPDSMPSKNSRGFLLAKASTGFAPDVSDSVTTSKARRFFWRLVRCGVRIPTH